LQAFDLQAGLSVQVSPFWLFWRYAALVIRFRLLDEAENSQTKGPGLERRISDEGRGDEDKICVG
jgi:hypothetical protein